MSSRRPPAHRGGRRRGRERPAGPRGGIQSNAPGLLIWDDRCQEEGVVGVGRWGSEATDDEERFHAMPKDRLRTITDYLPLFADKPLLFEPGTRQEYSHGGYVVLGAIIEKSSGPGYYPDGREDIF